MLRTLALALTFLAFPAGAADLPYIYIANGLAPPNAANVIDASDDLAGSSVAVLHLGVGPPRDAVCPVRDTCPGTQIAIEEGGVIGGSLFAGRQGNGRSSILMNGGSVVGGAEIERADLTMNGGSIGGLVTISYAAVFTMNDGVVGGVDWSLNGLPTFVMNGGSVLGDVRLDGIARLMNGAIAGDLVTVFGGGGGNVEWHGGTVGGSVIIHDAVRTTIFGTGFAIDGVPIGYGEVAQFSGHLTGTLENGDALDNAFTGNRNYSDSRLILAAPPITHPLLPSVQFSGTITGIDDGLRPLLESEGIFEGARLSGSYTLEPVPDADPAQDVGSYVSPLRLFTLVVAPAIIFNTEPAGGAGSVEIRNGPTTDEFTLACGPGCGIAQGAGGPGAGVELHLVNLDGSALTSDAIVGPSNGHWDTATGRLEGQLGGFDFTVRFVQERPRSLACSADISGDGVVNAVDLAKLKSVCFQRCSQ